MSTLSLSSIKKISTKAAKFAFLEFWSAVSEVKNECLFFLRIEKFWGRTNISITKIIADNK